MAVPGSTLTTFAALMKKWYTTERIYNMVLRNSPLLGLLAKMTDLEGSSFEMPAIYGDPPGASGTFSTAQSNKGGSSSAVFSITTVQDYALVSIDRKLLRSSQTDAGSLLRSKKVEIDGAINAVRRSLSISAYRDGTGTRSTIGSFANAVITLASPHDAVLFQKGDYVQLASGGALRNAGAQGQITAIDRLAGTITFGQNVAAIWAAAANGDAILRAGDLNNVIKGYQAWIPTTAPVGGDNFFTLDRSVDPVALAGVRFNATGLGLREALIIGQSTVATVGDGQPDYIFLHPSQYRALLMELESTVRRAEFKSDAGISFKGIVLEGDAAELKIIPDRWAPPTAACVMELDSWKLRSIGPCPDIFDRDTDQEMLREGTADAYEVRIGGYPQLTCAAPGHNGIITLDAQT